MKKYLLRIFSVFCLIVISMCMLAGCKAPWKKGNTINKKTEGQSTKEKINTQGATIKWLNVPYSSKSSAEKLDIYLPSDKNGPFPVIVAIHGGGFLTGDKHTGEVNPELEGLNRGYAVVCINYRLSKEAKWPEQIFDAKAAIRFIRANASKYKLDPKKIAVWGDSTGGNLASLLGTSGDVKTMEDLSMGNARESSRVQAVVDWFGPVNYLTMDAQNKASGIKSKVKNVLIHNSAKSPESKVMGKTITLVPSLVKSANPETYITADDPPFFIEHGTLDAKVPAQQSRDFAAALEKVLGKSKVDLTIFQGAGHGGSKFKTSANINKTLDFLDKYLK
ncbi:MAG: alpha/beta hydrolase [Clostridium sp.]|nr:alpha/beta hydrolase [Clostridium sp.]